MNRAILAVALTALAAMLLNCGGKPAGGVAPVPNIAGAWEFLAVSAVDGSETGVEVALQEGQTAVNGLPQPDGSLSASSSQIAFVSIDPATGNATGFGGVCSPTSTPVNAMSGKITTLDAPFNFTYTENGNAFTVSGTLSGDGRTLLNASYTSQSGSGCLDNGSITGTNVSKLSGMYTGNLVLPDGTDDNASATLSEASGGALTVNLVVTGTDNTTLTLSGPATGNAFTVQGTFQAEAVTYSGYYEMTYDSLTQAYDIPSLYLANTTNAAAPAYAGTLMVPQTMLTRRK
jgi:hypothetical protein